MIGSRACSVGSGDVGELLGVEYNSACIYNTYP